jgi:diguanylate cyclase (GGDEF)-like protein
VVIGLVALSALLAVACEFLRRRLRDSARVIDSVRHDHDRLEHSVRHDSLSGLLNRVGLVERLTARLDDGRDDFSVLYLDVDRFKTINDTLGHAAGDTLLAVVARRLDRVVGDLGDVARLGGDEFVIVIDDSPSVDLRRVAERLARSVVEPVEINGRLLRVSASVGVAIGPWTERSALEVLEHANQALHRAKEHGRDRIEIHTVDMRRDETRRAFDESELRRALDRGDVRPFFVPEYDVATDRLVGVEIVPRWLRDDDSIVDGSELLDLARDANTVERLTATLIREARPLLRRLELFGLPTDFRFRIELPRRCTPRAWRDGQIAAAFQDVDVSNLTLDVTPATLAVDPENSTRVLDDFRRRGARLCLRNVDDLSTIGAVAVDEIRVSGNLVDGRRPVDDAVLHALADLTGRLGLVMSADGVSTIDDSDRLRTHGCSRHQGPLLGRPLASDEMQIVVERDLMNT